MEVEQSRGEVRYTLTVGEFSSHRQLSEAFTTNFKLSVNGLRTTWRATLTLFHTENGCASDDPMNSDIGISLECLECNINCPDIEVYCSLQGRDQHEQRLARSSDAELKWQGILVSRVTLRVFQLLEDDMLTAFLRFVVCEDDMAKSLDSREDLISDLRKILKSGVYSDVQILTSDGYRLPAHRAILNSRSNLLRNVQSAENSDSEDVSTTYVPDTRTPSAESNLARTATPVNSTFGSVSSLRNRLLTSMSPDSSSSICRSSSQVPRAFNIPVPNKVGSLSPIAGSPARRLFNSSRTTPSKLNSSRTTPSKLNSSRTTPSNLNYSRTTPSNLNYSRTTASNLNSSRTTPSNLVMASHNKRHLNHSLASTRKRLVSPSKRLVSPSKRLVSPSKRLVSPSKRLLSPSKRLVSPSKRLVSPSKRLVSSNKHLVSPSKRLVSPSMRSLSPSKRLVSPSMRPIPSKRPSIPRASQVKYAHAGTEAKAPCRIMCKAPDTTHDRKQSDALHPESPSAGRGTCLPTSESRTPLKQLENQCLNSPTTPTKDFFVKVSMSSSVAQQLLEWIYTGDCSDMISLARPLLAAALRHGVKDLVWACENHLAAALTPTVAPDMLLLAHKFGAPRLREAALQHALKHAAEVTEQPSWASLADRVPSLIFEFSRLLAQQANVNPAFNSTKRHDFIPHQGLTPSYTKELLYSTPGSQGLTPSYTKDLLHSTPDSQGLIPSYTKDLLHPTQGIDSILHQGPTPSHTKEFGIDFITHQGPTPLHIED